MLMADDSEFVFRFQPAGPNDSTLDCLVVAPDEATASAIMRKLLGDELEFTLCTPWEPEQTPRYSRGYEKARRSA
jgi:hypothetical protein